MAINPDRNLDPTSAPSIFGGRNRQVGKTPAGQSVTQAKEGTSSSRAARGALDNQSVKDSLGELKKFDKRLEKPKRDERLTTISEEDEDEEAVSTAAAAAAPAPKKEIDPREAKKIADAKKYAEIYEKAAQEAALNPAKPVKPTNRFNLEDDKIKGKKQ